MEGKIYIYRMLCNLSKMNYLRCYKVDLLLRPLLSGIQISYAGEGPADCCKVCICLDLEQYRGKKMLAFFD